MNALINKNVLFMRRNLCSSITNFLVPIIITLLAYLVYSISSQNYIPIVEKYEDSINMFDPFSYIMKDNIANDYDFNSLVAIVSSEDTKDFERFAYNRGFCKIQCSFIHFKSVEDFDREIKNTDKNIRILLDFTKEGDKKIIKFQTNTSTFESIYSAMNLFSISPEGMRDFYMMAWINVQNIINDYLTISKPEMKNQIRINAKPLYTAPILNYFSSESLLIVMPIILTFMFISITSFYLNQIMHEKESRLTDLLYRQGITVYSYWISWFLSYFLFSIIPILISSIILAVTIFKYTSFFLIFFSLLLFAFNLFAFVFVFQACFKSAKTAQMLSNVVYILVLIVSYLISKPNVSIAAKYCFMIFPQFISIVNLEIVSLLQNFNSSSWTLMNIKYNHISLFALFLIYIFNFVLYIAVGWIIMKIKESGIEKLCERKIKPASSISEQAIGNLSSVIPQNDDQLISPMNDKGGDINLSPKLNINHEEITDMTLLAQKQNDQMLSIINATKSYDEVQAVRQFTGDIYNNQIFCLLGHNGAGKTTLIKMISGLEDVDSGAIMLDGHSLIEDKAFLYKSIGLCGQEDLFFDFLTVSENLELMCKLKGERANAQEIDDLLVKIQLIDKKESIGKTLSGGQKRKLCIALALIGHSKLVLLDEPTSGMDVIAKRFLWDFLKGYKNNKIIILTTHSLDEAEYLGDRIGIMSEGEYICSGTSSYLKNKYSCGYNINFLGDSSQFTKEKKLQFVLELKKMDSTCVIKSLSKEVLAVNFIDINDTTNAIFDHIDKIKNSFFIENYTVSTTSLEDVFLKLNSNELSKDLFQDALNQQIPQQTNEANFQNDLVNVSGCCSQFLANIHRTILPLWRNKSGFIPELIVSLIIFAIFYILFSQNYGGQEKYQKVNTVLSKNTIYYKSLVPESKFDINALKSSHLLTEGITLEKLSDSIDIKSNDNLNEMAGKIYAGSEYKYERAVLVITEQNNLLHFSIFYQMTAQNYYLALSNLITTYYIQKEFGKEHMILNEYTAFTKTSKNTRIVLDYGMIIASAVILWFSFVNFGGFMCETPVKDKVSNLKHLLFLSGANMIYYWSSHLIVDFLKYTIFVAIISPFLITTDSFNGLFIFIAIGYIISSNIMMYCFSNFLNKAENGRTIYIIVMVVGSIGLPIRYIYRIASSSSSELITLNFLKGFLFSEVDVLPASSFLFGMIRLSVLKMVGMPMNELWNNALWILLAFVIQTAMFTVILTLLEAKFLQIAIHWVSLQFIKEPIQQENQMQLNPQQVPFIPPQQQQQFPQQQGVNRDFFLQAEMAKANSPNATTAIRGISKTFCICCCRKLKAVNKLYLGLEANEKFGLLGFNGSGKTTTFKALTEDIFFDTGSISIFGYDIKKQFSSIRSFIGYCPQENALFDHLTVKECLHYFKTLKRLSRSEEEICQQFGLGKYMSAYCRNLSGGNKRKLCFAIALMAYPKLLLLDEPSTGVDPESRRVMWKAINDLSKHRSEYNMILSTHSMEEAEILCDTVGWLKKGSFLCVGNPEKLKVQFSNGYRFHIKCNIPAEVQYQNREWTSLNMTVPDPQIFINYTDPVLRTHFNKIDSVIGNIMPYCSSIMLTTINQDRSVEFHIQLRQDCQGKLFALILSYTKTDKELSEISIDMQSLEKILTSFEGPDGDPNLLR